MVYPTHMWNRWTRHLLLPTPIELGWSDHNALGMRKLTPYQEGKTWEDWHDHCKREYPAGYFLSETLPGWFRRTVVWPVTGARDWVLDRAQARRRCHKIDLRGVDPLSGYRAGYMDPSEQFRLAGWASLMRWHRESAARKDPRGWMTPEEQTQEEHRCQLEPYDEIMQLVQYWTVDRLELDRVQEGLHDAMDAIDPTPENREKYKEAQQLWLEAYQGNNDLEEKMWLRLCKIRGHLWD